MTFSSYAGRVFFLFALGFFGRFLLLFSTNLVGYWADSLCRAPAICHPTPSFLKGYDSRDFVELLITTAVIGFIVNSTFRVGISRTGARAVSLLYDEVTLRTSRLPMSFFDTTPVGRIVSRFSSDYAAAFRMAGGPLGEFLCLVFDLILILILTSVASLYFVPLVLAVAVLNFLSYRRQNPGLRKERRDLARERGPAIAHFSETVQGTSTIRVFGRVKTFSQKFSYIVDHYMVQRIRTAIAVQIFSTFMTSITALVMLGTGIGGIWLCKTGHVSIGSLGVAFTFIMMTSSTVQQFFEWLANLEEALTGVERMDDYLRRDLEIGSRLPAVASFNTGHLKVRGLKQNTIDAPKDQLIASSLTVEQLSLRYRKDLPLVLDHVSFGVKPGEQLAIIGRTGSGKSSLIQSLFCLYPFESGFVTIDSFTPILSNLTDNIVPAPGMTPIPLDSFRRLMALIPQDPSLFHGSLRENLCADEQISDDYLFQVLDQMGVFNFVSRIMTESGNPLDAIVEEKGANLSLGERQLLCMARAMIQSTPIMIMDEATSSIDPSSEKLLNEATQKHLRDRTQIIVAHRLSTIENADRVLWLDQGRIKMLDKPSVVLPVFSVLHRDE